MDEVLTVEEVAAFLKVHPRTILHLVDRKALKGVQVGRVWRIRRTDLEMFLEQGGAADDETPDAPDDTSSAMIPAVPRTQKPATTQILSECWFPAWRIDKALNGRYVHLGVPERLWQDWANLVGIPTIALQFADHPTLGRCIKMGPIGKGSIIAYLEQKDIKPGRQRPVPLALGITPRYLRGKLMNWYSNIGLLVPEETILACPHCQRYAPSLAPGLHQTVTPLSEGRLLVTLPVQCLNCGRDYEQRLVIRDLMESPS
jgi:excisionase family DNA binding protein